MERSEGSTFSLDVDSGCGLSIRGIEPGMLMAFQEKVIHKMKKKIMFDDDVCWR